MIWPGWTDVLPAPAALLAVVAALLGAVWTWARLSDRTVSRAVAKAGEESKAAAREVTEALYERLKSNDFKHLDKQIGKGLWSVNDRLARIAHQGRG